MPIVLLWEPVPADDCRLFKARFLAFRQHCYPWLIRINGFSDRLPSSLGADDGIKNQVFEFRSWSRYIARFGEIVAIPSPVQIVWSDDQIIFVGIDVIPSVVGGYL